MGEKWPENGGLLFTLFLFFVALQCFCTICMFDMRRRLDRGGGGIQIGPLS